MVSKSCLSLLAASCCLLLFGLLGCSELSRDEDFKPIPSPSGEYELRASIRVSSPDHGGVGIIMLSVSKPNGTQIDQVSTGASNNMKWAIGWLDDDTIVLYSSDIGTYAYQIKDENSLVKLPLTDEIIKRGEELKTEKYR